jgi:hypothetical protein
MALRRASGVLVLVVLLAAAVSMSGCAGKKASTPPSTTKTPPTTTAITSPLSTSAPALTSKAPSPTSVVPPSPTSKPPSPTTPSPASNPPTSTTAGVAPSLTLYTPEISALKVSINGVTLPGTGNSAVTKIGWEWGDGTSEEHWFPATHSYARAGEYTVKVTSYQNDGLVTMKPMTVVVQP